MARYDDPVKYTKTLVLETSDGQVTMTGSKALEMQRNLDNNARFIKIYDATKKETVYYDMDSAACGFCKVATLTSGKEAGKALPCEDPIPNCQGDES